CFAGASLFFPSLVTTTVSLGTRFANQAVRVRFRIGTDTGGGATGWELSSIAFTGLTNQPLQNLAVATGCSTSVPRPPAARGRPPPGGRAAALPLAGRASRSPRGAALPFAWAQVGGPLVTLSGATSAQPTFTAPAVVPTSTTLPTSAVLVFQLVVNDGTAA